MKKTILVFLITFIAAMAYAQIKKFPSNTPLAVGATDNSCIRADGTGGTLIQGSTTTCTIDDSGVISAGGFQNTGGTVKYLAGGITNTTALLTYTVGAGQWPWDFNASDTTAFTGMIRIRPQAATIIPLGLKAHSSQSANMLTVFNSSDAVLAYINKVGAIKEASLTEDPCADTTAYAPGTKFYNSTSGYYCYCNNANADVKMSDDATACF